MSNFLKYRLGLAALICFASAGLVGAAQSTPPLILQGVHRVVCLGDSITQGGEGPGGYVWLVRHYLSHLYPDQNIETLNAGISGHTSADMIARFQRDVLDKKPDLITISVGVNDVWHGFDQEHPKGDGPHGVTLEDFRKNVESMVTQAQSAGIKVVMLSGTVIYEDLKSPENQKAQAYNSALRDIARAHNCTFVDYQKSFRAIISAYRSNTGGRDNFLTVDGVHMNAEGNKVMASNILNALGVSSKARREVLGQVAADMRR